VILALVASLALQTSLARFAPRGTMAVDLVLVVVVYAALTMGPVTGLLAGAVGGLMQDVLSSGLVGIGGLAKTLVGFFTGVVGTQFIVTQPVPRFVIFFAATLAHAVVFIGLYELLNLRDFGTPVAAELARAAANAVLGVLAFQFVELLPGAVERRRAAKTRLKR
jgi:rod shape-determining protein MreD